MASRTARRPLAPTLSPHPKPAITMEDWDAKAPLLNPAVRSLAPLKRAAERPLLAPHTVRRTPRFASADGSRPATPKARLPTSRSSTPGLGIRPPFGKQHALHPPAPVQRPQEFYDWLALVDRAAAHGQEAHFRAHLDELTARLAACDALAARLVDVEREVEGMLAGWRAVEAGGKSLQEACERLLEERDALLALQETIGTRLDYFAELDHATRMLNHPGESLVLQTDFLYMVERVDVCIDFLRQHRHYKEAEVYLVRFEQCMTRAMTLIKMFFVGSLRALSQDISKRLAEKDVSDTAQTHLLYTRFRSVAPQLVPLLNDLERRARAHPDALGALLAECHAAYLSTRRVLLVGRLAEQIRGLDPGRSELVELTRAGCSYIKQLCTDEFSLYRAFFRSGKEQLYQYLETLCDYLYDDLRPRILHEPRLTALCEVCTVLQALMVLDVPALGSDDEDSNDEDEPQLAMNSEHRGGLGNLQVGRLLQSVLQDAQTRLFFKAQAVIQSEIRYYQPKPEDLAYPKKLVEARGGAGVPLGEKDTVSQIFKTPSLEKRETWYPTLAKTIWVLSQLHDFVQPAIFDDLAQESVTLCRQSLLAAASTLRGLDGALFLVRHLLILKELTRNIDLAARDGGTVDPLVGMLSRTAGMLPASLVESLGMARAEDMTDAKHAIDVDLKTACETVIALIAAPATAPLRSHLETPHSAPRGASDTFAIACMRDVRAGIARLRLYLEDARTVGVLVGHVRERLEEEYAAFVEGVRGEGAMGWEEVRGVISDATGEDEGKEASGSGA
ncbi:Sec34-like family-domain-containing protein [Vararia minispora EC-137]|uniref:Sec34-like family-domain-containing protein n=1 Tax=Vararia minispora EC-137 TaxID=1314806 RepID=A0ACB8QCJ0_9AGAM|nr:Sec34-like family-domain-containing protein [Vararia minispora EC-137]